MTALMTRRRFALLSVAGALGGAGYGMVRVVKNVRDAAGRMSSQ